MSSKNIKLLLCQGVWEVRDTEDILYFESEEYDTSLDYALGLAEKQNMLLDLPSSREDQH